MPYVGGLYRHETIPSQERAELHAEMGDLVRYGGIDSYWPGDVRERAAIYSWPPRRVTPVRRGIAQSQHYRRAPLTRYAIGIVTSWKLYHAELELGGGCAARKMTPTAQLRGSNSVAYQLERHDQP